MQGEHGRRGHAGHRRAQEGFHRRHGQPASGIGFFTHGTTVGVNTVIQRRGANALATVSADAAVPMSRCFSRSASRSAGMS